MPDTTYRGGVVAIAIKDFLEAQKNILGLSQVFYGNQLKIPNSPIACVEPAVVERPLTGTSYQTTNTITVGILIYSTSLDGTEAIQKECDDVAERVADAVNKESINANFAGGTQFGGKVVSGHCRRLEFGYRTLNDRLMRANRVLWEGITKTPLFKEET